jgi:hypothetical protein
VAEGLPVDNLALISDQNNRSRDLAGANRFLNNLGNGGQLLWAQYLRGVCGRPIQ